jgi:diguanylate cyclase
MRSVTLQVLVRPPTTAVVSTYPAPVSAHDQPNAAPRGIQAPCWPRSTTGSSTSRVWATGWNGGVARGRLAGQVAGSSWRLPALRRRGFHPPGSKTAGQRIKSGPVAADLQYVSETGGAVARAARAARGALPHGQLLTPEVWARRHRGIVVLLWLHVAGLAAFGVVRGKGLAHSASEAAVVAVLALLAGWPEFGRRDRSAAAVLGLITSSAILVHLSGGVIEMHFHFFVMIGVITLYQDWLPFGLALAYVVVHHGMLGTLRPTDVFNHPAAWHQPWKWALIHGGFVLAASVAYLVNWRLSEAQATEIGRLLSRLEGLARTDALTGIPNRRVWDEELPRELERARRVGTPLCVAIIDLDHFKAYNDRYGHQAGDRVLKEAVGAWRTQVRSIDLLARYGGEEFVLLLPACALGDAIQIVERLRAVTPLVTCSVGMASWDFLEGPDELVGRADRALYAAKAGGRNRHVTV